LYLIDSFIKSEKNIAFKAGNVLSGDVFYDDDTNYYKKWAQYGVLCVEMETAGLYTIAAKFNVQALAILTISDSLVTKAETSQEDRASSFNQMIEIALELA
jgi:purine-nucleoside phosphorylase